MCAAEIPRAMREIGALSGLRDGIERCAEDAGTRTLPGRATAYRSAQDRSARLFGWRAYGGRDGHAFREAFVSDRGCGRQSELPPGFCRGSLSGTLGRPRKGLRDESGYSSEQQHAAYLLAPGGG